MSEIRESRRADIIRAAIAEFAERGYERTKMGEIARRAGIGKSTVYEYFPSKDELLSAAGEWVFESATNEIQCIFAAETRFYDMVCAYLRYMHRLVRSLGMGVMVLRSGDGLFFEIMHSCGLRFREVMFRAMCDAVTGAQARGEVSGSVRPEAATRLLLSLAVPAVNLDGEDWEQSMHLVVEVLFQGLLPRPGGEPA